MNPTTFHVHILCIKNFDWKYSKGKVVTLEDIFLVSYHILELQFIWFIISQVLVVRSQFATLTFDLFLGQILSLNLQMENVSPLLISMHVSSTFQWYNES
jgi:hypothetical protein